MMRWLNRLLAFIFERRTAVRKPVVEELEQRILYSADANPLLWAGQDPNASAIVGAVDTGQAQQSAQTVDGQQQQRRREIVFVDAAVPDAQKLIDGLLAQRGAGVDIEVVQLRADADGLAQMTNVLSGEHHLDAIHIISHGDSGQLTLGNGTIDAQALRDHGDLFAAWRGALSEDADILLYGCNVAEGAAGQAFVAHLASVTGADVAASTDLTGTASVGGNWILEASTGRIEAGLAVGVESQNTWAHTLTTLTKRVAAASDDAEEEGPTGTTPNRMWLTSSDIELVSDFQSPTTGVQKVGLRFTGMNIPVGATITNAYLVFRAIPADSGMTNSDRDQPDFEGAIDRQCTDFHDHQWQYQQSGVDQRFHRLDTNRLDVWLGLQLAGHFFRGAGNRQSGHLGIGEQSRDHHHRDGPPCLSGL